MIYKNLLLCSAFVVSCTSIMASEKESQDVVGKEPTSSQQRIVVEDKKEESSVLQQLMLKMKKIREENQKMAEKLSLPNQSLENTAPKVDDKKVAVIPQSTAQVIPPLEAPTEKKKHTTEMLKEDAKFLGEKAQKEIDKALPKAKEELEKVVPKVEKEVERVAPKVEKEAERVVTKVEQKAKKFFRKGKF